MEDNKIDISILYVEDEETIRMSAEKFLRRKVKNFFVAENGEEGLETFKKKKIDIVISDIRMPKMDGLEMISEIKKIDENIITILITAHSDYQYMISAIELGVDKYITKPIDLKTLENSIRKLSENISLKREFLEQKKLLSEYKDAIDKSAIVSKTDLTGYITYVNDKFCKISGYSKDELIGAPHNIIRDPDTKASIYQNLWNTILNKQVWKGVLKNRAKNGTIYYTDNTIIPILNSSGEIEEFISIRYDITELEIMKRKKEKIIIQSKAKLLQQAKEIEHKLKLQINNLEKKLNSEVEKNQNLENKVNLLLSKIQKSSQKS